MKAFFKTTIPLLLCLVILMTGGGFSLGKMACSKTGAIALQFGNADDCCEETFEEVDDCCALDPTGSCCEPLETNQQTIDASCCKISPVALASDLFEASFSFAFSKPIVEYVPVFGLLPFISKQTVSFSGLEISHPPPLACTQRLTEISTFRI
jgi:hypothetical protein